MSLFYSNLAPALLLIEAPLCLCRLCEWLPGAITAELTLFHPHLASPVNLLDLRPGISNGAFSSSANLLKDGKGTHGAPAEGRNQGIRFECWPETTRWPRMNPGIKCNRKTRVRPAPGQRLLVCLPTEDKVCWRKAHSRGTCWRGWTVQSI